MASDEKSKIEQTIEQARINGSEAVAELLEVYRPWLTNLAEKRIYPGLRRRLAVSDVVQGSLISAVGAFDQFRGHTEAELTNWLKKIFRNHLFDRQREIYAQKRNVQREVAIDENHIGDIKTPSEIVTSEEAVWRVMEAIAELDEELRTVVQLRYLSDLNWDEIGERLGLTRYAVCRRWTKAIDLLARRLVEPGGSC